MVAEMAARTAVRQPMTGDLPHHESDGYLVRDAHRAFQRLLERRIAPHGVTRGQWYFLRVLWTKDGLSQRELSDARRHDGADHGDRAPQHGEGRPDPPRAQHRRPPRHPCPPHRQGQAHARWAACKLARGINAQADEGISADDIAVFRRVILRMTANLDKVGQ